MIGEKIRETRKALGISQGQLAYMSGVHLCTINKIERGKRNPSDETVKELLTALESANG